MSISYDIAVDREAIQEAITLFEFVGGNSSDALRIAINKTIPKTVTNASSRIREQVRLTATYVKDKLEVKKASRWDLNGAIRTPTRGLLLSKFSTNTQISGDKVGWYKPPPNPPQGIKVKVKPGGPTKEVVGEAGLYGTPFYMVLTGGALGIAARRKVSGAKGGLIEVFYGPSLSQVFNTVRDDVLSTAASEYQAQLLDAMRYLLVKQYPPEA
jgi:hypothetical protein